MRDELSTQLRRSSAPSTRSSLRLSAWRQPPRRARVRCQTCDGFPCLVHAKYRCCTPCSARSSSLHREPGTDGSRPPSDRRKAAEYAVRWRPARTDTARSDFTADARRQITHALRAYVLSRCAASTKEADFGSYLKFEIVPALIFSTTSSIMKSGTKNHSCVTTGCPKRSLISISRRAEPNTR